MKKLYATMVMAFAAMTASAQQTTDSTFVRMSFNDNPWNLPTSEMKGWSQYNDEKGCLSDTHTFSLDVNGEELKVILTPSNYKLTDWENCMVRGEDPDDGDKVKTILMARQGSQFTFQAPASMWFAKVAFETYRRWSSGSLYSGSATNNQHVWGKDSLKIRYSTAGGQQYELECWSGDSIEWSLPECTGQTYLHYIDFWLLPREGVQTGIEEAAAATLPRQEMLFDLQGRRLNAMPRKGVYIIGRRKIVK